MSRHEGSQLVKGAFILTLAGLISKMLSAAYRIPLQNLTGDIGFYIYQQVYPFLGMIIILSLYGFPSAVAKIIADMQGKGEKVSVQTVYWPLFAILFLFIGIGSVLLWLNAHTIAYWIGDPHLATAYQWIAIACLFIPFTSLFRGIFQGYQKMNPIAYSQVSEQLIRVSIIMIGAYIITTKQLDVYQIGVYGVIASICGALVAICILLISLRDFSFSKTNAFSIPWRYFMRTLFVFGIVASLNHMVLLIIQFADVFTLVPNLIKYGLSPIEAMEAKGVFDRGQPLIQLGTVLGSSFALAFIPAISKHTFNSVPAIRSALKVSFYLATGAVIGLLFIFEETNILLYQNNKGTSSLQVLSLSILLSSLSITFIAIIQSLGHFKRTAAFILLAFFVKWIGNLIFVPYFGIMGSAIATVVSLLFLSATGFVSLKRHIPSLQYRKAIHVKPLLLACISMVIFLIGAKILFPYDGLSSRISLLIYVVILSGVGACIYILMLIRFRAFSQDEIEMFPFTSLFMRIYKGRDIIE